jgi:serine/threonine protein phosphatase PrpC
MTPTASDEPSRGVLVSGASLSHVGRVRSGNEDALVIADLTETEIVTGSTPLISRRVGMDGVLLAVADGMGGAQAGEVASRMAVEQLADTLMATAGTLPISKWLREGLKSVNRYICNASQESSEYAGMGATITAVVVHGVQAIIGQVGDSRAYLIRDGQIEQVTKDQSMVQVLLDAGVLTQEEAVNFPQRNVILHALGTEDDITLMIARFDGTGLPLQDRDRRISVEYLKENN